MLKLEITSLSPSYVIPSPPALTILTLSQVGAARDPVIFPNPHEVDVTRPLDRYIHYGDGPHTCLGKDASMTALTAMWKVVGRLDNLRRARGPQGQLKKIPRPGGFFIYMREDNGSYFPFPTSELIFHWCERATANSWCSNENQLGWRGEEGC